MQLSYLITCCSWNLSFIALLTLFFAFLVLDYLTSFDSSWDDSPSDEPEPDDSEPDDSEPDDSDSDDSDVSVETAEPETIASQTQQVSSTDVLCELRISFTRQCP